MNQEQLANNLRAAAKSLRSAIATLEEMAMAIETNAALIAQRNDFTALAVPDEAVLERALSDEEVRRAICEGLARAKQYLARTR